ncbi:MAG TPA: dihydrolipoyl dehydrogenase [Trueperaceae bacterium]|nr:dihydrolipoyl dehydrogenase [Trueperaceae bacterium]HRP46410.1 dihydrolipoyl dehydrogenase [Trueperaceae bacterium]
MDFDLIVIGSGPGGYHAAIRASQLGLKVACVEKGAVGGVCLNIGCIPTKALLHVGSELRNAKDAAAFGIDFGTPKVDLQAVDKWKLDVVKKQTSGVGMLFKGNKVTLLEGEARFTGPNTVEVAGKPYSAPKFIVATGSRPAAIPGFELDGERIVDSTGALNIGKTVPARMVVIGAGAIGLEFADVYSSLGSEVTVVEMLPNIAGAADIDASKELRKALEKRGIRILTSTKVLGQKETKKGTEVTVQGEDGKEEVILADRVLVAVGRRPNGANLGLENAGVKVDERGFVTVVNDHMQTSAAHVYAIGDVARAPLLAHKAMKEGVVAAEHAAGQPTAYDTVVPSVIYTSPELASVGMTEEEATKAGFEVRIGRFPLAASGRASTLGVNSGLIKLIGDAATDMLLGFHMVGPNAGDIVSEAALAIEMGATLEDIALTQHPHPTISEGVMEAAEHAHGKAIHIANRRR